MTRARDLAAFVSNANQDINLDADGGQLIFKDGGTQIGRIRNVSSGELTFQSDVSDKDMVFNGKDGGSTVTALTLDMSAAGAANFNSFIYLNYIRGKTDNNTGINIAGSDVLAFQTGGTERVRIIDDGLTFNGDTAASNALSDYEEGTWTASASVGSITPNVTATYTKIGSLVTIYFDIRSFTNTSNSGAIQIDGLPFASTKRAVGAVMHRYLDTLDDSIVAYVDSSLSSIKFLTNSSSGWAGTTYADINNANAILAGTITYRTV